MRMTPFGKILQKWELQREIANAEKQSLNAEECQSLKVQASYDWERLQIEDNDSRDYHPLPGHIVRWSGGLGTEAHYDDPHSSAPTFVIDSAK